MEGVEMLKVPTKPVVIDAATLALNAEQAETLKNQGNEAFKNN